MAKITQKSNYSNLEIKISGYYSHQNKDSSILPKIAIDILLLIKIFSSYSTLAIKLNTMENSSRRKSYFISILLISSGKIKRNP